MLDNISSKEVQFRLSTVSNVIFYKQRVASEFHVS